MTYQEKYEELFNSYADAIKALNNAVLKISFANGFDNIEDVSNYTRVNREFRSIEREFQRLLDYFTTANINPTTEYIPQKYMYDFIKKDQQGRGIPWDDDELAPQKGVTGYECVIGITNDGENNKTIRGIEYKFPVLNLHHGIECYNYLSKMLQNDGVELEGANNLKFAHIDETHPIFIKVVITIWL